MRPRGTRDAPWDVLVVGAGPTGLALAAAAHLDGASVLVVDRQPDRVHESRALAIQPRTLEVLRGLGVADELVRRGNAAVRLQLHARGRTARMRLFDVGLGDTEYPFLLFLAQSETEAVLGARLALDGVPVERGVTLEALDGADGDLCTATVRDAHDEPRQVVARYVVGCDGAHSTVRRLMGVPFLGGGYPQTFLLADLAAEGLEPGTAHAFVAGPGPFLVFPLLRPAPWRVIAMRPTASTGGVRKSPGADAEGAVLLELQALADEATGGTVRLHAPVWATTFGLQHRRAARYRAGRVFLAGDAAHVHSPAGAQGMNTGIQDAVNLAWKLALVARGRAAAAVLDSYDAERRPVGEYVVRFTDRAFRVATSDHRAVRFVRARLAPYLLPLALSSRRARALAFRTVGQLGVHYRNGPAVEGVRGRGRRRRPRAGDRLPDAVVVDGASEVRLQAAVAPPGFHVLLATSEGGDPWPALRAVEERHGDLVGVHVLRQQGGPGILADPSGAAMGRLHVRGATVLVVRPDGHVGYRGDDVGLDGARRYLSRLLR